MAEITAKSEIGLAVVAEMMSPEFSEVMRGAVTAGKFGSDLARFGLEHSFADVWARDGMERKMRSLVLIGALIAQVQPEELGHHIRIGLNNGLTVKEIEEALITASPYVGLPAISTAYGAVSETLRSAGVLEA